MYWVRNPLAVGSSSTVYAVLRCSARAVSFSQLVTGEGGLPYVDPADHVAIYRVPPNSVQIANVVFPGQAGEGGGRAQAGMFRTQAGAGGALVVSSNKLCLAGTWAQKIAKAFYGRAFAYRHVCECVT